MKLKTELRIFIVNSQKRLSLSAVFPKMRTLTYRIISKYQCKAYKILICSAFLITQAHLCPAPILFQPSELPNLLPFCVFLFLNHPSRGRLGTTSSKTITRTPGWNGPLFYGLRALCPYTACLLPEGSGSVHALTLPQFSRGGTLPAAGSQPRVGVNWTEPRSSKGPAPVTALGFLFVSFICFQHLGTEH